MANNIEPISHLEVFLEQILGNRASSGSTKEYRFINLSEFEKNTDFIDNGDGSYSYNTNNKRITEVQFLGTHSYRSGSITFIDNNGNNLVLPINTGFDGVVKLQDTTYIDLKIVGEDSFMSGQLFLTLE